MAGKVGTEERAVLAHCAVAQLPPDSAGRAGAGVTAPVTSFQAWLASVDVEALSDRERVDLVGALERVKGSAAATQARATHALRCTREQVVPQDVARSVGAEVALARRESPTLGDRFVGLSRALVTELPETMKALTAGVIGERHAVEVVQQSATLTASDRAELDRRLGPVLGRLGVRGAGNAARRIAAELDAAAVVRRMEAAVRSRRVTVRPAPDGMAYLTVLGPMPEVVGAYASLRARASAVVGGQCPEEGPEGRGTGAVMADTATRLLSGRAPREAQPVEVHLVMTDRALLGTGDPARSVFEPARVPGHGSVPAPVARAWLRQGRDAPSAEAEGAGAGRARLRQGRDAPSAEDEGVGAGPAWVGQSLDTPGAKDEGVGAARVWIRRLYTSPDGRDLVAMDSRRRLFRGLLRRMLVIRDDVCSTPWCEAPIAHADHTVPARHGGPTSFLAGAGMCARCNLGKEAPGWSSRVLVSSRVPASGRAGPAANDTSGGTPSGTSTAPGPAVVREARGSRDRQRHEPHPGPRPSGRRVLEVTTPLGRVYESQPPPLLGWGSAYGDHGDGACSGSAVTDGQVPTVAPAAADGQVPAVAPAGRATPGDTSVQRWVPGRKRPCRRARVLPPPVPSSQRPRRARLTSHLERRLCRLLL